MKLDQWEEIAKDTAQYLACDKLVRGMTADELLALSPNKAPYSGPIDWSWGLNDQQADDEVSRLRGQYEKDCNQVEFLLGEAGILIDRSLGDLLKYDDLNVDRFKLCVEFVEYYYLSAQQEKEKDDIPYRDGLSKESELYAQSRTDAYVNNNSPVDEHGNIVHSDYAKEAYPEGVNFLYNKSQAEYQNSSVIATIVGLPRGHQHRPSTCNT